MKKNNHENITGIGMVLMAALLWGSSFSVRKMGMSKIGPLMQNAGRFFIGFCFMLAAIMIRHILKRNRKPIKEEKKVSLHIQIKYGVVVGTVFALASTCQQIGLAVASAGQAGFITAIYTVEVPFLAWIILKERITPNVWIALIMTFIGLYCITGLGTGISSGVIILFIGSLLYATQIILVHRFIAGSDAFILVTVQVFVGTVISLIAAVITSEEFEAHMILDGLPAMAFAGIMSLGIANLCQFIGQKYIAPNIAAIACSFEAVFGLVFGTLLLNEQLTLLKLTGCGMIFVALIIVQYQPKPRKEK